MMSCPNFEPRIPHTSTMGPVDMQATEDTSVISLHSATCHNVTKCSTILILYSKYAPMFLHVLINSKICGHGSLI